MTPREALALQAQRPQLPSNWGGTFDTPLFRPAQRTAPAPMAIEPSLNEIPARLLAELERIATARETLPTPCLTTLARRIGVPIDERTSSVITRALEALAARGLIAQWSGGLRGAYHGQRIIALLASGREIRTPGAPWMVKLG